MADETITTERERTESTEIAPMAGLLDDEQVEELRERWTSIQSSFIDEPRRSVAEADRLVSDATGLLTARFEEERERLEEIWESGEDVTTEDLRITLQRYRSFFDRLLRV